MGTPLIKIDLTNCTEILKKRNLKKVKFLN